MVARHLEELGASGRPEAFILNLYSHTTVVCLGRVLSNSCFLRKCSLPYYHFLSIYLQTYTERHVRKTYPFRPPHIPETCSVVPTGSLDHVTLRLEPAGLAFSHENTTYTVFVHNGLRAKRVPVSLGRVPIWRVLKQIFIVLLLNSRTHW